MPRISISSATAVNLNESVRVEPTTSVFETPSLSYGPRESLSYVASVYLDRIQSFSDVERPRRETRYDFRWFRS